MQSSLGPLRDRAHLASVPYQGGVQRGLPALGRSVGGAVLALAARQLHAHLVVLPAGVHVDGGTPTHGGTRD